MLYDNPMTKHQYAGCLRSAWWKSMRDKRLALDKGICQRCGKEGDIVHHKTYENMWHEDIDDLATLCSDCHKRLHVIAKKINRKTYMEIDEEIYAKTGEIVPKGEVLSIGDIWNVTRESPEEELSYMNVRRVCATLDAEMDGTGKLLSHISRNTDGNFELLKKLHIILKELDLSADQANKMLGFLQSKKFIVKHSFNKKIMVNPYLGSDRSNEVRLLCYYNKFCDYLAGDDDE